MAPTSLSPLTKNPLSPSPCHTKHQHNPPRNHRNSLFPIRKKISELLLPLSFSFQFSISPSIFYSLLSRLYQRNLLLLYLIFIFILPLIPHSSVTRYHIFSITFSLNLPFSLSHWPFPFPLSIYILILSHGHGNSKKYIHRPSNQTRHSSILYIIHVKECLNRLSGKGIC